MQTLCVVGDDAPMVADTLVDAIDDCHDGAVAIVDYGDSVASETSADTEAHNTADGRFSLTADGRWVGRGDDRSLVDLLDSLAPTYEFAVIAGTSHHRLPTVVVGDVADKPANIVADVPTPDAVDVDDLAAQIDDFEPHVTLQTLIDRVEASPLAERAGAIATFTGRVRVKDSPEDTPTEQLAFEKYENIAADRMAAISDELTDREGVFEVLMHHRVGVMGPGEDIVFVVVLAGHRAEAFRTVEDGINRLKDEVPIFKKETTAEEEFWLHKRE
ncbi:MAG: molybdopterin converting factor, large subunit [Halonotius sp. J07HN4]|jgi:molybdopterin synthase subunit MoaE/molybdopterin guanine dinucleotide biosynthesis accessory protein MobB|nr:MAG: molybdopterin converting factor, large subunit [Halonotius sp. J07HN4]